MSILPKAFECPHCKKLISHLVVKEIGYYEINVWYVPKADGLSYDSGYMNVTEDVYAHCPECKLMVCPEEQLEDYLRKTQGGN